VDEEGRKATIKFAEAEPGEAPWGTGLVIEVEGKKLPEHTPVYIKGIQCHARESRFGGVVIQPVEAWQRKG
jgi:hypothetical protein